MTGPIYLDYNATTPLDPEVVGAMEPYLREHFGNPSSNHVYGQRAREAVKTAREQLAALLGVLPEEVRFTGGGSEANNLAIKGVTHALRDRGDHVVISAIEHPSVNEPLRFLKKQGLRVTILPTDEYGRVDPSQVAEAITDRTILVSIMLANNEVGTLQPIQEIAAVAHTRGVWVHTDAAQAVGKIPVNVEELGVDLLSVAGHKFYTPKGVGALIVHKGVQLEPLIHGAGQEGGLRAGTENVPYLVGLGKAAELAASRLGTYQEQVRRLRDLLYQLIRERLPQAILNGHPSKRLPNTLNLSFPGVDAAVLLAKIQDRVACSTGSACHANRAEPSAVLLAMGRESTLASAALRLSLGLGITEEDIRKAAAVIAQAVPGLTRPSRS